MIHRELSELSEQTQQLFVLADSLISL